MLNQQAVTNHFSKHVFENELARDQAFLLQNHPTFLTCRATGHSSRREGSKPHGKIATISGRSAKVVRCHRIKKEQ